MLCLSRKKDTSVVIGNSKTLVDNVVVTVLEIYGNKVRLGFTAHKEIPIYRKEVWHVIEGNEREVTHFVNDHTPIR